MKKFLCSAVFVLIFGGLQAQEGSGQRRNDVMISPIELIVGPALNISYEHLITENSGVGLNYVGILSEKDSDGDVYSGLTSQLSPYYRQYFGKKYGGGFFVEGFLPITTSKEVTGSYTHYVLSNDNTQTSYTVPGTTDKKTTFGVGVGFGGKWITHHNIIFEASVGVARRFGDLEVAYKNNDYGWTTSHARITGKGMLGIGYRF